MSFILTNLAQKKIAGWNNIPQTYEDGEILCNRIGVRVIYSDIKSRGEYVVYKKVPFIVLRKNLKPKWRAWVLWHELAHHLLHYPGNYLFTASSARKVDFEANFVAAIALIPTAIVEQNIGAEIMAEFGYPKELIRVRFLIYEHYKI